MKKIKREKKQQKSPNLAKTRQKRGVVYKTTTCKTSLLMKLWKERTYRNIWLRSSFKRRAPYLNGKMILIVFSFEFNTQKRRGCEAEEQRENNAQWNVWDSFSLFTNNPCNNDAVKLFLFLGWKPIHRNIRMSKVHSSKL